MSPPASSYIDQWIRDFSHSPQYLQFSNDEQTYALDVIRTFSSIMAETYHQHPEEWQVPEVECCVNNQLLLWVYFHEKPFNPAMLARTLENLKYFFAFLEQRDLLPQAHAIFELLYPMKYSVKTRVESLKKTTRKIKKSSKKIK